MRTGGVKVRRAKPADIATIVEIRTQLGLSPWPSADCFTEIEREDSVFLCVESEGVVAGFINGRLVPGSEGGGLDAEVYNIGVSHPRQRTGLGTVLLTAFLDECRSRGVLNIWLDVRVSNTTAAAFYRRFDFRDIGRRKAFYCEPLEDSKVMKLEIAARH